jgi:hypothetical protein
MIRKFLLCLTVLSGAASYAAESGQSSLRMDNPNTTNAQKSDQVGIGVQAGSLTGVNAQYWFNNYRALNAAVTFTSGNTGVSVDHRWFDRDAFSGDAQSLAPFVGAGLLAAFGDRSDVFLRDAQRENFGIAAQVPVGLEWLPNAERFSVFGELTPSLELAPIATLFLTADVGARFYF